MVEDHTLPTLLVGGHRRAHGSVEVKFGDRPDAVRVVLGASTAVVVPAVPVQQHAADQQQGAQADLCGGRRPIRSRDVEQWRILDRLGRTVQHKHIRQAAELRGQQHHAHQRQMEGQDLDGDVEAHVEDVETHVEDEHLSHGQQAQQCTQRRSAW
ncbi:hypothetical protein ABQF33_22535 [Mycolicibacterium sp. XJ2]